MTQTPPESPAPGWYPDPNGSGGQRWWDGANWSDHVAPGAAQGGWGGVQQIQPGSTASGYQYGTPPAAVYGGYAPQVSPLTPSGMRRLQALFSDVGRILSRAWLPIVGASLIIWLAWTAVLVVLTSFLIDFENLKQAIEMSINTLTDYPSGDLPATLEHELASAWESVPRPDSIWPWIAVAVCFTLLTILAAGFNTTAVNQLGIDAAAGQPARLGKALRRGLPAAFRLTGYLIFFVLLISLVALAWGFLLAAAIQTSDALGVIMGAASFFGFLGMMVLVVWATGRLIPVLVQVLMGGGAISWSWRATRGKFWGVLGRYLLWSLVASLVVQVVLSVVFGSAYLVILGSAATGNESLLLGSSITFALLFWPISLASSSLTIVGVVPIWRDLTDNPTYRSIGPDGFPVPEPVAPGA